MNLVFAKKPAETAPPGPPLYARPGRRAALSRSLALADEMVGRFASLPSDDGEAARAVGWLRSLRADLRAEAERTVEPEVHKHWQDTHAREQAEIGSEIGANLPGARAAVSQFIDKHDYRQAVRYAEQLVKLPLACWERRHGVRHG
jgi:hypothetical protein